MKKGLKRTLIGIFVALSLFAFCMTLSGCSAADSIKNKIEQSFCDHEWNEGEETRAATCSEAGEWTKTCTACGKTTTEDIPCLPHETYYVEAIVPTCTGSGIADGRVCLVCEQKVAGFEELPALGHRVIVDKAVTATCLESGLTAGEHCAACGEVLKAQQVVEPLGHKIETIPAKEQTCTEDGCTQSIACVRCGAVYEEPEIFPALGHVERVVEAIPATCTTKGVSNGVICETCGEVLSGFHILPDMGGCWDETLDEHCDLCGKSVDLTKQFEGLEITEGGANAGVGYRLFYFDSSAQDMLGNATVNITSTDGNVRFVQPVTSTIGLDSSGFLVYDYIEEEIVVNGTSYTDFRNTGIYLRTFTCGDKTFIYIPEVITCEYFSESSLTQTDTGYTMVSIELTLTFNLLPDGLCSIIYYGSPPTE